MASRTFTWAVKKSAFVETLLTLCIDHHAG